MKATNTVNDTVYSHCYHLLLILELHSNINIQCFEKLIIY